METQETVAAFIARRGIEVTATVTAINAKEDDWEHDAWEVTIKHGRMVDRFSYRMGIGNRIEVEAPSIPLGALENGATSIMPINAAGQRAAGVLRSEAPHGWIVATPTNRPSRGPRIMALQAPKADEVLWSLASDADAFGRTFEEWAGDLGYDTDSRKAEATYRACVDTASRLARLFGFDGLQELQACEPL